MTKISNKTFAVLTSLLYAGFVSLVSYRHVVWRDEVVPMTQVMGSHSLSELCAEVHGFGHPMLWYFLLYIGHLVVHSFCVLKIVNILVCVGAIYIFMAHAPFSRLQKVLFVLGFFPLYLYPVFSRDYGISMLLLFAFAAVYPKRFEQMVPLGCILLLLANAHAHSLITTMAILLMLAAEFTFCRESRQAWQKHFNKTVIGFAIILIGMLYSGINLIPDHKNIVFNPHPIGFKEMGVAVVKSVIMPGKAFIGVFGISSALFTTIVVIGMYLYLLAKPYLFIFFSVAVICLSMFYHIVFQSDEMRHQGALYLLIMTVLWIEAYVPAVRLNGTLGKIRDFIAGYKESFFVFLLILQVCMSYSAVMWEITSVYSSSKSFGTMLNNSRFKDAVLVGEPGAMLEAIPYYAGNDIYLPREGKFRKYTEFSTDQKPQYSLTEVLMAAKKIKVQTGKQVLIVLGHKLPPEGPYLIHMTHGRSFTYSKGSLDDLIAQTTLVAVYNEAASDENYRVYLLK